MITIGWLAASMTLLTFLTGHIVSFHWHKRAWHKQAIGMLSLPHPAAVEYSTVVAISAGTRMQRIEAASASAIESQVAQRIASQTPSPASEAVLREFISDILRGQINSERLSPQLLGALRKDLPKLQAKLAPLGSLTNCEFIRASSRGADEYNVTHEHGSSRWGVVLDPNGVITGASVPL